MYLLWKELVLPCERLMVVKLFNLIRFRASMHLILETGEHKSFAQQQNVFR